MLTKKTYNKQALIFRVLEEFIDVLWSDDYGEHIRCIRKRFISYFQFYSLKKNTPDQYSLKSIMMTHIKIATITPPSMLLVKEVKRTLLQDSDIPKTLDSDIVKPSELSVKITCPKCTLATDTAVDPNVSLDDIKSEVNATDPKPTTEPEPEPKTTTEVNETKLEINDASDVTMSNSCEDSRGYCAVCDGVGCCATCGTTCGISSCVDCGENTDANAHNYVINFPVSQAPLLPRPCPIFALRPLLILDLDETLLHSSVNPVSRPDAIITTVIGGTKCIFYVLFRPYMREFLNHVAKYWEVCVFTASVCEYANRLLNFIDPTRRLIHHRLFRQHCKFYNGLYIKDLFNIGRPLSQTVIVDNTPHAYLFNPQNAVPITTWTNDKNDTELKKLIPILDELNKVSDVRTGRGVVYY